MKTDLLYDWHVLQGDSTLERALRKDNITDIKLYQKEQLDSALNFCKQFRHAIDIGANYGIMSYNMSKMFDTVSSFEIVPNVRECLRLNVSKFNLENVDIYECGLGNKEELVSINFNPQSTFSTHINLEGSNPNILIKNLDSFNFENVDFIKIDAEGFEPLIIEGGINTIIKYKPVILYERKGHETRYGFETSTVLEMLKPYGYETLFKKLSSKNGLIGVI